MVVSKSSGIGRNPPNLSTDQFTTQGSRTLYGYTQLYGYPGVPGHRRFQTSPWQQKWLRLRLVPRCPVGSHETGGRFGNGAQRIAAFLNDNRWQIDGAPQGADLRIGIRGHLEP